MAGTAPVFYDQAKLKVVGVWITIGTEVDYQKTFDEITAAATWGSNKVKKPSSLEETIVVPYADMEGHVDFDALEALEDGALHAIEVYPEGDAAGKRMYSGNAYVKTSGLKGGLTSNATGTLTLNVSGGLTKSPSLALSVSEMGTTAVSGASAYVTPVASGGTSTYALTIVRGILPEGISMSSGGVFSGTVAATANVGTYLFEITVTDSAATPVVKVFPCSLIVTA